MKNRFWFLVSGFWLASLSILILPAFPEMRAGAAYRVVTPDLTKEIGRASCRERV